MLNSLIHICREGAAAFMGLSLRAKVLVAGLAALGSYAQSYEQISLTKMSWEQRIAYYDTKCAKQVFGYVPDFHYKHNPSFQRCYSAHIRVD